MYAAVKESNIQAIMRGREVLDLVHGYALMKEFTRDSCTRAAFGIYVQLRIYCWFGRHSQGGAGTT